MDNSYFRIILIGNGFDTAMGLKTSYSDFILSYLQKVAIETFRNQSSDTGLLSLNLNHVFLTFSKAQYITKIADSETVKQLLELIEIPIQITHKYDFFEDLVNELLGAKWVDIEQYYYDTLKTEFRKYKGLQTKGEDMKDIIELHNCMDAITFELNSFIEEQQNSVSVYYKTSHMASLIDTIRSPLTLTRSRLINKHNKQNPPAEILFLNFNYTDTMQRLLDDPILGDNNRHIHIHGTVNGFNNPIIFGYGDDTGEEYQELELAGVNELLKKIKSFQYPRTHNYHHLLNFLESNVFDVFVVGHSCGLSDRTLLKTIFEHSNCLAIQNFHYKGEPEDFEKRMDISRHFTDKVLMRERVLPYDEDAHIPQAPTPTNPNTM